MRYLMLLLLGPLFANTQELEGTYFIVATCKEGMVVGVDSRSAIMLDSTNGDNQEPGAYFDKAQKAFVINDFVVVHSGHATFGGHSLNYYLTKFANTLIEAEPLKITMRKWIEFSNSIPSYQDDHGKIVFAKCENDSTKIGGIDYIAATIITGVGSYMVSDTLGNFGQKYTKNLPYKKLSKIIVEGIYSHAKESKRESSVGGPITLILITKTNKIKWLSKIRYFTYEKVNEVWSAYKNGTLNLTFTSADARKRFNDMIAYPQ
jgi:hypothetical protein